MENIQFENDALGSRNAYTFTARKQSSIVKILLKLGVPNERVANYILIGFSGLMIALAIYMYVDMFSAPEIDQEATARDALLMQVNEARQ